MLYRMQVYSNVFDLHKFVFFVMLVFQIVLKRIQSVFWDLGKSYVLLFLIVLM